MGATAHRADLTAPAARDPVIQKFARLLWDRYRARVYLFGSRARGTDHSTSDYDLVAVSDSFADVSRFRRCLDRDALWLEAGGWRKPLDLQCYAPDEFRREKAGLGYLGHAHRSRQLVQVAAAPRSAKASTP